MVSQKMIQIYNHSETQEGEVCVGHYTDGQFKQLTLKTKRMGNTPFPGDEFTLREPSFPVFVQVSELKELRYDLVET